MKSGLLSTVHSTSRFGTDCPRRIIFAAFHVGSKRNGGGVDSCVNVSWPFTVTVSERGVRFLLRRSFQSSALRPEVPEQENLSPVTIFMTFHSPQSYPTDIVSSARERRPSPFASRPNTTSTPFDGVASSSIRTANSFASFRDASNTQLVMTSQSKRGCKKRGCKCHGTFSFIRQLPPVPTLIHGSGCPYERSWLVTEVK